MKHEQIRTNRTAVLYARVSSEEQEKEGYSIPAQIKALREYAERKGISVLAEYVDVETAKKPGIRIKIDILAGFASVRGVAASLVPVGPGPVFFVAVGSGGVLAESDCAAAIVAAYGARGV